jgi:hypothetical protein
MAQSREERASRLGIRIRFYIFTVCSLLSEAIFFVEPIYWSWERSERGVGEGLQNKFLSVPSIVRAGGGKRQKGSADIKPNISRVLEAGAHEACHYKIKYMMLGEIALCAPRAESAMCKKIFITPSENFYSQSVPAAPASVRLS